MARRPQREEDDNVELNLAPIMNMVMILIPLLLLSSVFIETGVINISSPRNAQSTVQDNEEREQDTPVPQVFIVISDDGFRVGDMRGLEGFTPYTTPIARCGGAGAGDAPGAVRTPHDTVDGPPTICLRSDLPADAPLVQRLDYASLYNHLARIRMNPEWFDNFGKENNSIINILGQPDTPFNALVKTMDTARFFLLPTGAELQAPTASSNIESYMLGGGSEPSLEDLETATILVGEENARVPLFPDPVLLLPRPSSGS